jgi:hypothetical protein
MCLDFGKDRQEEIVTTPGEKVDQPVDPLANLAEKREALLRALEQIAKEMEAQRPQENVVGPPPDVGAPKKLPVEPVPVAPER